MEYSRCLPRAGITDRNVPEIVFILYSVGIVQFGS